MNEQPTIRDLEHKYGIQDISEPNSALEIWYDSIRDKVVDELTINDLCVACRQDIFPKEMLPVALKALEKDPIAGHQYDGELIFAVLSISPTFWVENSDLKEELRRIVPTIDRDSLDVEIDDLLRKVGFCP